MASATAVLQYKGESLGRYIRERKLLLAARDLRDTDQRVYDICLKYGFDSQQTFTRILPVPSISRRARIAKRTTAVRTERRLHTSPPLSAGFLLSYGLICQREPAAPYPAQYQILNYPQR